MRTAILSIASLLIITACTLTKKQTATSDTILIKDVTLVSPEREIPLEHASVLIQAGKIVKVGTVEQLQVPDEATVVMGKGKYLIPGLMDSHVHLQAIPGVKMDDPSLNPQIKKDYEIQLPKSYLYFGFTTLVDLNVVDPSFLQRFKAAPLAPDLYDCSGALVLANGYPMNFAPADQRFELFPNFIVDSSHTTTIPERYQVADHQPKAAVARVKAAGGICVKTHWESGFGREKLPTPSKDLLKEIAKEAKNLELVSIVHANSLAAQQAVIDTDIDVIGHGLWNWGPYRREKAMPQEVKNLLDEVAKRKLAYMPTIQVIGGLQSLFDPSYLKDPRLTEVVPQNLLAYFKSNEGQWFKELLLEEEGESIDQYTHQPLINKAQMVTGYLANKKANLIFGSDTPSGPTYGNIPGYNGYLEMKRWIASGVKLKQLLYSATLGNARAFHLDDRIGSIEAGKIANLLLLDQNPYQSVEAYDRINMVIIKGVVVERSDLKAAP